MARRRPPSENVGWGKIPRMVNTHRRDADELRALRALEGESAFKGYRRKPRQHPTSREFEQRGRVEPREEQE